MTNGSMQNSEHESASAAVSRSNANLLGGLLVGVILGAVGAFGWGKLSGVIAPKNTDDTLTQQKLDYIATHVYAMEQNLSRLGQKLGATGMAPVGNPPGPVGAASPATPPGFGSAPPPQ